MAYHRSFLGDTAIKALRLTSYFTAICSVVVLPIWLLIHGWRVGGREFFSWKAGGIVILGLVVILSRYYYVASERDEEFKELQAEFKFFFFHAPSAWSFGGGLACILMGLFFLFPVNGALFERYSAGLSLYVGVIGATLGIHAFYKRTAPITDMNHLLKSLTEDLDNLNESVKKGDVRSDRLWIVYPALNIGYYRNINNPDIYDEFKFAALECASRLKQNATAVTYATDLYRPLYECYDRAVTGGNTDATRIEKCVADAIDFQEKFQGTQAISAGRFCPLDPTGFPPHVFIIGDVTYLLMSYGMPIYEGDDTTKFHSVEGERLVRLLAFRRDDPTLAALISEHLKLLVQPRPATPPEATAEARAEPLTGATHEAAPEAPIGAPPGSTEEKKDEE